MIIHLTEEEAITIADFLVNSINAIMTKPTTPTGDAFIQSADQLIFQVWTQSSDEFKKIIIEEQKKKLNDIE